MQKVAIIDNGVSDEYKEYVKQKLIVTGNGIEESKEYGSTNMHASTCIYILKKYYSSCQIYNIDIFSDNGEADVNYLNQALQWCLENKMDVVSLSIGTSCFEDVKIILPIINKLLENKICIIASANNCNSVTYPASLDGVIGVKCDLSGTLNAGELFVDASDIRNIEVTVGSLMEINEFRKLELGFNNSFVVPYVVSKVCCAKEINQDVYTYLNRQSKKNIDSKFYVNSFPVMYKPNPIILKFEMGDYSVLSRVIDLFQEKGYSIIGIVDRNEDKIPNCYSYENHLILNTQEFCDYIIKSIHPDIVLYHDCFFEELEPDCIVKFVDDKLKYDIKNTERDFSEDANTTMTYIGNYGNYGISVSDAMDSIKPENFYFEGEIDQKTKEEILDAIIAGKMETKKVDDIKVVEINLSQLNMLVEIIEDIFC